MKYYLVGIKGSGMASLAHILYDLKNNVRGADIAKYVFTEESLKNKGVIIDSLDDMHYEDYDVIVVGNSFVDKYTFKNKIVKTYQEMLSTINDKYYSIAICGTHGKTTTTNMIKHVLSKFANTSYLVGDGQGKGLENAKYFVYEACEHRDHFLNYHPNVIVCLNIDYDHVEYFLNKKQYKKSFFTFFNQCKDKLILLDSIEYNEKKNTNTFGFKCGDLLAKNIKYTTDGICFDMTYKERTYIGISLPFYGQHMLINSLACILCCVNLSIDIPCIINELKTYKHAGRRYNIRYYKSNVIVDDYGHHPNEIKSTITALKQEFSNMDIVVIYHPDRPKRLTTFLNDYINVFSNVKKTYVLPFLKMGNEETRAINLLIKDNIIKFDDSFYDETFENTIILFTGSKDMSNIINILLNK